MSKLNSMKLDTKTEYEYILNHGNKLNKYAGKWIAVLGENVICSNKELPKLWISFQKQHPDKIPFFMKVLDKSLLML